MYGESNVGKTFLALSFAAAIASGESWIGDRVVQRGTTIYAAAEGGAMLPKRLVALGLDTHLNDALFILDALLLRRASYRCGLLKALDEMGITELRLVIVDTLAMSFNGNENSARHG